MAFAARKQPEHIGETYGCADHDHDLVHELSKRLDALWRYDQYVSNADRQSGIKQFWEEMKQQERSNVKRLKELIAEEIKRGCF